LRAAAYAADVNPEERAVSDRRVTARLRAFEADVEGRPALELRDEDREVLAELLAEILVDVVESQLQEPA
jgi:hypothetical protein